MRKRALILKESDVNSRTTQYAFKSLSSFFAVVLFAEKLEDDIFYDDWAFPMVFLIR